ncbi:hypothetical protein EV215_1042 [Hypnocyclicus thermotrophus]|uniref:Carboxypeptidase-like protein n=1 Tax=Hypnocyclicus thermotrophus TaxID=1627895 RepID=A0AA46DYQ6_9FUSO|nr:carboxypeptidase-like regulatory domain-containing protein [Hypnocyclicus thermotrophus]TDT70497.1 hypothetical protein EV215_1042 [Hypnocyclicus thermotrophus]
MKKNIFILFFIINIFLFAKEYNIYVFNENYSPISAASIIIDNTYYSTDFNGYLKVEIPNNEFFVSISKNGYINKKIFVSNNTNNINIMLIKKNMNSKKLFVGLKYDNNNNYYFLDSMNLNNFSFNSIINFYNDNKLIYSFDYHNSPISIDILPNIYDVKIINSYNSIIYKNIIINENTKPFLLFSMKKNTLLVKGIVKSNNYYIGGAKITFTDINNNNFETFSNITGNFYIELPKNDYTISIEKIGYKSNNIKLSVKNNIQNLELSLKELGGYISGYIIDEKNNPINNALININNSINSFSIYSNDKGFFKVKVPSGINILKITKNGYLTNGIIKNIKNYSSIENLYIKLEKKVSNLKGRVIANSEYASNVNIFLYKDNKHIATTTTNKNGFYIFENLPLFESYKIIIKNSLNKDIFTSKDIFLTDESDKEFNIFYNYNYKKLILEFPEKFYKPVYINNKKYLPDSNSLIYLDIDPNINSLEISIPEYNYKNILSLTNENKIYLKIKL